MGVIDRIRQAVREKQYRITDHALDEADADNLLEDDIIHILLTGNLDSTYTDDLRGTRYIVRGNLDRIEIDVVCRFRNDGSLLIIVTVYRVD